MVCKGRIMSKHWAAKYGYKFLITPQMREEYEYYTLKFTERQKESDDFDEEAKVKEVLDAVDSQPRVKKVLADVKKALADIMEAYPEPRAVRVAGLFNRMRLEIIERERAKLLELKGKE